MQIDKVYHYARSTESVSCLVQRVAITAISLDETELLFMLQHLKVSTPKAVWCLIEGQGVLEGLDVRVLQRAVELENVGLLHLDSLNIGWSIVPVTRHEKL